MYTTSFDPDEKPSALRHLGDEELRSRLERIAKNERKLTVAMIEHIAEVERRRLYFDWGFQSMFEYLTRELAYSEGSAFRRIQAARALIDIPELKEKMESGVLKLSQVAEAQTSFRQEEKCTNARIDLDQRKSILEGLENKSGVETRKILVAELPTHVQWTRPTERQLQDESVQLNVNLEKDTYRKLSRVRNLYSHIEPNGPWPRVFDLMADDVIQKRDPLVRASGVAAMDPTKLTGKKLRAYIFLRDEGKCQHRNPDGSICGSDFQIEIDHIQPKFADGEENAANLRLLCRRHNLNRYRAGTGIREV